jgi:hypothetical protein
MKAEFRDDRFACGWNDTAHGILTWSEGCSADHATPAGWAAHCRTIARAGVAAGDDGYMAGVVAAVDHYLLNGTIDRKPAPGPIWED